MVELWLLFSRPPPGDVGEPSSDGAHLQRIMISWVFNVPSAAPKLWQKQQKSRSLTPRGAQEFGVFVCFFFVPPLEHFVLNRVFRTFAFEFNLLNSPAASNVVFGPVQKHFPTFLIKENNVPSSIPHLPHQKERLPSVPRLI